MKDALYFPHDSNATNDPKIMMLIDTFGLEGYGIFWIVVEHLREQPNYRSHLTILKALAKRFGNTPEKFNHVVKNYGLFEIEKDEFFYSKSLMERMEPLERKREIGRASAEKRWKQTRLALGTHMGSYKAPNASKVKESKGKESKRIEERAKLLKDEVSTFSYPEDMKEQFISYWTEPNKSKTKMRFELEKTWDTGRRLNTWARRSKVTDSKNDIDKIE